MSDAVDLPEEVIVSMRCSSMPQAVSGSERRECTNCGQDVWASPATRRSIRRGVYPDVFACLQCAREHELEN